MENVAERCLMVSFVVALGSAAALHDAEVKRVVSSCGSSCVARPET